MKYALTGEQVKCERLQHCLVQE